MLSYLKNFITSWYEEEEDGSSVFKYIEENMENEPAPGDDLMDGSDVTEDCGTVTLITKDYGIIDKKYSFPTKLARQIFKVGDEVVYHVRHTQGGGGRILSVATKDDLEDEDEAWEESLGENQEVVTICKRDGRTLVLSNQMTCNLDTVLFDGNFTPVFGDVLKIDILEKGGEMKVSQLHAFVLKKGEGVVTEFDNFSGRITNKNTAQTTWFTRDALERGFDPIIGDYVEFIATENASFGANGWRAISVGCDNNPMIPQEAPPDLFSLINNGLQPILIKGSSDFGEVLLSDDPKKLTLEMINTGSKEQLLQRVEFRRGQSQVIVEALKIRLPFVMRPNASISLAFTFRPLFIGRNTEILDVKFQDFSVSRRFEMLVQGSEEFRERVSVPPVMMKPNFVPPVESLPPDQRRTFGARPFRPSHFRRVPSGYSVPAKIQEIMTGADGVVRTRREELEALAEFYPVLKADITFDNYAQKFHTLLYCEETTCKIAVAKLARCHVFFRRCGEYLVLDIPNLAEQRPSLIVGDRVVATQPWCERDSSAHTGFIHLVGRDSISVVFSDSFQSSYDQTDCDVRFESSSNTNYLHAAVKKASLGLGQAVLFPQSLSPKLPKFHIKEKDVVWHNKALNAGQRAAVVSALRAECRPLPHILFGPPGTGKTVSVVEVTLQILRMSGSSRVLVAAPSNSAADLLAQRIIAGGNLRPGQLVRLLALSRDQESVPEKLAPYCTSAAVADEGKVDTALGWHRVTVSTCTSLSCFYLRELPPGHFTHVIIDEAGYATEPQLLMPLNLMHPQSGVAILAGDPEQLGPVVLSSTAEKCGLSESFLARVMQRFPYHRDRTGFPDTQGFDPRLITRLTMNYRSVPEILALPNRLFYNSELEATVMGKKGREAEIIALFHSVRPVRPEPVSFLFHGVRGSNYQEPDSPSWMNPQELFESIQYVRLLYGLGVDPSEIAVVTPYRKQARKIQHLLTEMEEEVPKVGSVEELQGQERQVVIMSCVRSRQDLVETDRRFSLGFLSNPRRLNVALTRARALLIVIGDPHLLCQDTHWRSVLVYCLQRNAYIGCDIPAKLESAAASKASGEPLTIPPEASKTCSREE